MSSNDSQTDQKSEVDNAVGLVLAIEQEETAELTSEHREFLMARHGTVSLDPMPTMDPEDPYNWPRSKKMINLSLLAFNAFISTFTAACLNSSFIDISKDLGVSLQAATYQGSLSIAVQGVAPLFFMPLAKTYGSRPVFLVSLICSLVGNIGCAQSPTYETMALCRAIASWFICPAAAIGSGIVAEMFFKHERATFMGVWTIMVTLGVPVAAFICGFVALRVDYRWIYWVMVITNGVQFLLYLFLGSETSYRRDGTYTPSESKPKRQFFKLQRFNPNPITWWDFVEPFKYFLKPVVCISAIAYAMVFMWAAILPSLEIPQIFPLQYGFNTQQVGLQYLSFVLGSIIGEQIGGWASDWWMLRRQKQTGVPPPAEHRLWLSYSGLIMGIVGLIVFMFQVDASGEKWNITPLVGTTIAAVGNQVVTTVYMTYSVDCYREDAAGVGVFISFVRQIWGFIGPLWFPQLIEKVGMGATAGVGTGMMVGLAIIPTIIVQWKGGKWHH